MMEATCITCEEILPITKFPVRIRGGRDGDQTSISSRCKSCTQDNYQSRYYQNRGAILLKAKKYYEKNKEIILARNAEYHEKIKDQRIEYQKRYRLGKYNLTKEEYEQIFYKQLGCCACCGDKLSDDRKKQHLDHIHLLGEGKGATVTRDRIRGILCSGCNQGLGNFRDDPHRLQKAIDYLQKAKTEDSNKKES